jgi:prepilin-type N-terminal cleavage/methylation domain-containing protein
MIGKFSRKKAFTLVEVSVVIGIIAVLSTGVFAAIRASRNQAKYTQTRAELAEIKSIMLRYKSEYGQLPPIGDSCSACTDPASLSSWTSVLDSIRNAGIINQSKVDELLYDAWGNVYAYDDNYGQSLTSYISILCSGGPDGRRGAGGGGVTADWGKGDDVCDNIKHEGLDLW